MAESQKKLSAPDVSSVLQASQIKARLWLRRLSLYAVLGVLVALGYALLVTGLSLLVGRSLWFDSPLIRGLLFFFLALAFFPVRTRLESLVNRAFLPGRLAQIDRLARINAEFSRAVDLNDILRVLQSELDTSLSPARVHIFTYDPLSDQYQSKSSDLRFPSGSAFVRWLSARKSVLVLQPGQPLPTEWRSDHARLQILEMQAIAPIASRGHLLGWVALGARSAEQRLERRELEFVTAVCEQAARVIERARRIIEMETQVREVNVLARVAQGVNVTLSLDDLFELIYAQTTQIIPADEFRIILKSTQEDAYAQVFYVHGEERMYGHEHTALPPEPGLEVDLIHQGRALLSDDYIRECRQRGLMPLSEHVHAWIGAPLNAGADSIGLISLGRCDPDTRYTREQLRILQTITDQAAGAIIKARLLEETERRARQLKTLNEVTRQLTSTLDPQRLLKNILHSAVDILNCEAGALLMHDPQSDELVFQVVLGPIEDTLSGYRMAASAGIGGRTLTTRQPLIVNDVYQSPDWVDLSQQTGGYKIKSVLAVPLLVNEHIIGVLEVLNRLDGSNFTHDDQELLSAFAAQAVVAIENARLYTLTDQALADRVEELSVMQRIDRELNTSLDIHRAMQITLEWAMRQSGADAGLVGMVTQQGIRLMTSQGYDLEDEPYRQAPIPGTKINLTQVLEEGAPARIYPGSAGQALLSGTRSQALIPIKREKELIGVILLESRQEELCSQETLDFLQRLGDHASIAIANAQLYAAIEAANLAKSDFVSFVAHELKNPMTSIKGYTELLAAQAVGPVNDAQANFLAVIRANIERMNTLVSDLNDLSKIEAGRMRLEFAPVDLMDVVQEVERSARRQFEEKSQKLKLEIPEGLPLIWGDRTRLVQILVNLVSNANKYTGQGGEVLVGAVCANSGMKGGKGMQVVHVWVQDSGIGIAPEDQPKIFQKFFRSEDPKTREAPGAGLGLNITRSLVEMQGGQIWFESQYRQGTTFHFTVPVAAE